MMKTITKLFLFVILIGVIFLYTTCGKQYLNKYVTWEGVVLDSIGGKPVQGITVVLNACGGGSGDQQPYGCQCCQFGIGSSTTDASGHFYIHGKAARTGWYYPMCNAACCFNSPDGIMENDLSSSQYTQIILK